jgi:hypothetical protein
MEDAGEAAGEGDDGHLLAAARGDAQGLGPQLLSLRRPPTEDRDRGLTQEPAGARVAGLGDGAVALGLARGHGGPAAVPSARARGRVPR